jgi:hypothetical protein
MNDCVAGHCAQRRANGELGEHLLVVISMRYGARSTAADIGRAA